MSQVRILSFRPKKWNRHTVIGSIFFFGSDSRLRCLPSANRILFRPWRMFHSDQKKRTLPLGEVCFFVGMTDRLGSVRLADAGSHTACGIYGAQRSIPCHFPLRFPSSMFAFRKPNLVSPLANVSFRPKKWNRHTVIGSIFLFRSDSRLRCLLLYNLIHHDAKARYL